MLVNLLIIRQDAPECQVYNELFPSDFQRCCYHYCRVELEDYRYPSLYIFIITPLCKKLKNVRGTKPGFVIEVSKTEMIKRKFMNYNEIKTRFVGVKCLKFESLLVQKCMIHTV